MDGTEWLRKEPERQDSTRFTPAEVATEAIALRLARAAGLDAAESAVALWAEGERTRKGLISKKFTRGLDELSSGNSHLSRKSPHDYDPSRRELHTLQRVRDVLMDLEETTGTSFLTPFAQMLAFDAWVGHADRHQENWSTIRSGNAMRLAPLYDTAACLGRELGDGDRHLRAPHVVPDKYLLACPSGFGDGRSKRLRLQREIVNELSENWPEWQAGIGLWLAKFQEVLEQVETFFEQIGPEWLSNDRKNFAHAILTRRLEWLRLESK